MKTIKSYLGFFCSMLLLLGFLVPAVDAATSDSVTATVTAQLISVSVTDGTVTYGTLATSATANTTSGGLDDTQTATNDGNVTEDFDIAGQDSASWTLESSAGTDQYTHEWCTSNCDSSPVWNEITTSYSALTTSVSTSGTQDFDLRVGTPSTNTASDEQSVDVTILASAS